MNETCESYQESLSGLLDGELTPARRAVVEAHLAQCAACTREYEILSRLASGARDALADAEPPEEDLDGFVTGVYNRLERRTGWFLAIAGALAFLAYGMYLFVVEPWAGALLKLLIAAPLAGIVVLFVSVLRQRLRAARHDRYSKEVYR